MAELALTDNEALALSNTTDAATGAVFVQQTLDNWAAAIYRWMHRALAALNLANQFRVYEVESNADAVGVRLGRTRLGATVLVYAGEDPAVDGLTNNDVTYIWGYSNAGTFTIASAVDGTGWPAYPHIRLAEVTMVSGEITAILDRRSEGWWYADALVRTVEHHTADDTMTIAESGSWHTNSGASGTITISLPAATVGLQFFFRVKAAQQLRIDPNGSETIALPSTGAQGAAGKYLWADADGEYVKLVCTFAGTWTVEGYIGTWTAEP